MKSIYRRARWSVFWRSFRLPEVSLDVLAPDAGTVEPVFTDHLGLPPYEGPTDHNDAVPLLTLARSIDPGVVLELGTGYGATTANLCAATAATVYTVNALPEQIDGHLITYTLTKEQIGCEYRRYGFADRVTQIYANTKYLDVTAYLPPKCVDLAIIDACHDMDFVVNDFLTILPAVKDGGTVMFHDVHPGANAHLADGYLACMYLRKIGFGVRHLTGTWWGIWRSHSALGSVGSARRALGAIDELIRRARGVGLVQDVTSLRWLAGLYLLGR